MIPLYVAPYAARVEARNDLGSAMVNAADAVALLAMVEREILDLTDELRLLRDKRNEVCAQAAEAELRYAQAADHYRAVHVRATPWSPEQLAALRAEAAGAAA